jgi:hypothetical protein
VDQGGAQAPPSHHCKDTHKFGIELPHSAEEAFKIDKRTGTDFWAKVMAKEQRKVKVAWKADDSATVQEVLEII